MWHIVGLWWSVVIPIIKDENCNRLEYNISNLGSLDICACGKVSATLILRFLLYVEQQWDVQWMTLKCHFPILMWPWWVFFITLFGQILQCFYDDPGTCCGGTEFSDIKSKKWYKNAFTDATLLFYLLSTGVLSGFADTFVIHAQCRISWATKKTHACEAVFVTVTFKTIKSRSMLTSFWSHNIAQGIVWKLRFLSRNSGPLNHTLYKGK